jgi:hypothetical protein
MALNLDKAYKDLEHEWRALRGENEVVGDEDWDYILGRSWQTGERQPLEKEFTTEADLVEAALEVMCIRRDAAGETAVTAQHDLELKVRATRRAQSPGAPEWWPAECRRALERFREDQRRTLADFGLLGEDGSARFAALEEVCSVVRVVATQEPEAGERLQLRVPTGPYEHTLLLDFAMVTGWRGRWPDREMDFLRDRPSQRMVPGEGRFARLYDRTRVLADMTGCYEEDAVAFLLCGRVPWMPWIELLYDDACDATLIRVRHPEVSATEVAAAFRDFSPGRTYLFGRRGRQRRRRLWPERVETFVDAYRAEHSGFRWDPAYKAFCERYGAEAKKKYTTMRGFQSVYSFRKRKRPPVEFQNLADRPDDE